MKAWITKDYSGEIFIFNEKPIKNKNSLHWHFGEVKWGNICWGLNPDDIPDINPQWENDEPIEVELIIRSKK